MKKITVYADFDFLTAPQEIGTLDYDRVRGNDHFAFKYSGDWLKSNGGIILSGDLMNVSSQQLKDYITNSYKVMMSRGIKGCYVFAYNENLRKYLKNFFTHSQN